MNVINKIRKKDAVVGVIGIGYVGLPLMLRIAKSGYKVIGVDTDTHKVISINQGHSYIEYINDSDISSLVVNNKLYAQDNYNDIENIDIIIICVPTPITINKSPDLQYIHSSVESIGKHLRKGHTIILESTTFPGTTESIVLPILEKSGLKAGKDFFLGYSPERVDPGNNLYNIKNTTKVISGITKECTKVIYEFYTHFVDNVYKVSSPKIAEMAKIHENTFRNINIALANQLSLLCNKMNINVWEVIEAASTKPFGFMPFYPGPGLGGHCIPLDPLYISWKAKEYDFFFSLIEISNDINTNMPYVIVDRIKNILNKNKKHASKSNVLLLGASYKNNISDTRESPIFKIFKLLKESGFKVDYNDPFNQELVIDGCKYSSQPLNKKNLNKYDCTVILINHENYDYNHIIKHSRTVFDTRNAIKEKNKEKNKIYTL